MSAHDVTRSQVLGALQALLMFLIGWGMLAGLLITEASADPIAPKSHEASPAHTPLAAAQLGPVIDQVVAKQPEVCRTPGLAGSRPGSACC